MTNTLRLSALTLLVAPLSIAATVPAGNRTAPAGNRDIRCLMLSNLYTKAAAASAGKESAAQARLFYLGRISGRLSPVQLQTAMAAEAKTIDPDKAGDDMTKCVKTIETTAATVEAAGHKAQGVVAGPPAAH